MRRQSRNWAFGIGAYVAFMSVLALGPVTLLAISTSSASAQSRAHKHHGCKHHPKHGRCHRHRKPKQGGKKVHLVPPIKTGTFCNPRVFANPDPAECGYNPPPCTQDICGPLDAGPPCFYLPEGECEEVPAEPEALEIKNIEVFQARGFKEPPTTYGCADISGLEYSGSYVSGRFIIEFHAEHGSFSSRPYGGIKSKYEPSPQYCGKYEPPCPENMPADGFDEAWVVAYDRTKNISVESEHVKFNIEEPENVRYPAG